MRLMPRVREVLARRDAGAQIAVVLGAFAAYEVARHAMQPNWAEAFANARGSSRRAVLGFAWEQSLQRAFLAMPDLMQAMNIFYFVGHFVFTGGLLRLALLPLVGRVPKLPRRLPDRDGDLGRRPLRSSRPRRRGSPGSGSRTRCSSSPGSTSARRRRPRTRIPVAAVPWLHAAYALGRRDRRRPLRPLGLGGSPGVVYPPLVILTIVVTGNHFVLDAVAGIAVIGVGFLAVRWWQGRNRERNSHVCAA